MNTIKLNNKRSSRFFVTINKTRIVITALVLVTLVLELVNISLTNRMATDSIEASQLKKELAVVVQENNVIRAKVYELASYDSVASRAAEFGFKEAVDTISLDTPVQVAHQ